MPEGPEQSGFALAYSAAVLVGSSIAGCTLLGYFLDRWLATSPYLSVAGLLVGTVGAFLGFFRIMSRIGRDDSNREE